MQFILVILLNAGLVHSSHLGVMILQQLKFTTLKSKIYIGYFASANKYIYYCSQLKFEDPRCDIKVLILSKDGVKGSLVPIPAS